MHIHLAIVEITHLDIVDINHLDTEDITHHLDIVDIT